MYSSPPAMAPNELPMALRKCFTAPSFRPLAEGKVTCDHKIQADLLQNVQNVVTRIFISAN